jgi:Phage integrase, N-terminal SAM-like domain
VSQGKTSHPRASWDLSQESEDHDHRKLGLGKVKLGEYASAWITERPGLRPRTMDLYRWLFRKHIEPHLGCAPIGRLSTRMIREWRATLLANGVSVSVAAKAYRLLRAILMTAVEDDRITRAAAPINSSPAP